METYEQVLCAYIRKQFDRDPRGFNLHQFDSVTRLSLFNQAIEYMTDEDRIRLIPVVFNPEYLAFEQKGAA